LHGNGAENFMSKVLYILGLAMLLIPMGWRFLDGKEQEGKIATYSRKVEYMDEEELVHQWKLAKQYNQRLYKEGKRDENTYETQLDFLGNGMMGSVEIPKIDLKLPIYHGTEEAVLAAGVGHLKESSFPVGGENTHCVLTGHRGAPDAQLFTRLDEMEMGDLFFIHVCQKTLCYRVCEIQVVKPEEVGVIEIQKGEDLVSLITCTPYGLNTHRLVVTGKREMNNTVILQTEEGGMLSKWDQVYLAIPCMFGTAIFLKQKRKGVSP